MLYESMNFYQSGSIASYAMQAMQVLVLLIAIAEMSVRLSACPCSSHSGTVSK